MSFLNKINVMLIGGVSLLAATSAFAHPRLLETIPANGSVITSPAQITLTFSESLLSKFSKVKLSASGEGDSGKAEIPIAYDPQTSDLDKTLTVVPRVALPPGHYTLNWHVVSKDTHVVNGKLDFSVKP